MIICVLMHTAVISIASQTVKVKGQIFKLTGYTLTESPHILSAILTVLFLFNTLCR